MSNFTPEALSLLNAQHYDDLWSKVGPVNRRLDGKFQALAEALEVLEERSNSYYPTILILSASLATLPIATALTGLTITGVNFLGTATKGSGTTGAGAGSISWSAVRPGEYDVALSIATDGGLGAGVASVAVSGDDSAGWTVEITHNAATAAAVVAAVAAHATAKYVATGTVLTGGTADNDSIDLTPGTGEIPSLAIGSTALDATAGFGITSFGATSIVFDFDPTALVAGKVYVLMLRCDGVLAHPIALIADGQNITTGELAAGVLSADASGRALMAADYFNSATALDKFAVASLDANTCDSIFAASAIDGAKLKASDVPSEKLAYFKSATITGTGAPQNTAHGLGRTPGLVLAIPVRGHNGAGAAGVNMPELVAGVHDGTNAIFTAEAGAQYIIFAL